MAAEVKVFDERGGLYFVDQEVWDALEAVGLAWREGVTNRIDSQNLNFSHMPELAHCDFCHAQPVTWDVDAGTFDGMLSNFTSIGGWAACEDCGLLIQANDYRALQRRVMKFCKSEYETHQLERETGEPWHQRMLLVLDMLQGFWRHYRGIKRYNHPYESIRKKSS